MSDPAADTVPRLSPLDGADEPGEFGNLALGAQVTLSERGNLSVCDVQAWLGSTAEAARAIGKAVGLPVRARARGVGKKGQAFNHAPSRWTVIAADAGLADALVPSVGESGSVTDISHGRTVLRMAGEKAPWVLSKLFVIDFAEDAFGVGTGIATGHHALHVQLQRVDTNSFDLVIHRSDALAFWAILTRACEEVGYRVTEAID